MPLNNGYKNVYFNIYLLQYMYIFVIYHWINFIGREIDIVALSFLYFSNKVCSFSQGTRENVMRSFTLES